MRIQGVSRAAFADQVQSLTEVIRAGCDSLYRDPQLQQALDAVVRLRGLSESVEPATFSGVCGKLEELLQHHVAGSSDPRPLEIEVVELACDWLLQLASLYREALPQPQALVSDLLNTFDRVAQSKGAETLAELIAFRGAAPEQQEADLFADDPLVGIPQAGTVQTDPFANDPGFGMESDLLQQTLYRHSVAQMPPEDPFGEDPLFSAVSVCVADRQQAQEMPFDVFSEDPEVDPS
jgi:hypothetical protein